MWMMGCNSKNNIIVDDSDDFNFNVLKLRPLAPRPTSSSIVEATTCSTSNSNNIPTSTPLFSLNHHIEQGKSHHHEREYTTNVNHSQSMVVSSRWNPTPEQLMTLEDLYRRGTRTPSAEQIQQITTQLRRYGKIEGKNVFYWFQNHKARERQKRRRQQIEFEADQKHQHFNHQDIHGATKTEVFKVEQTKNCPIITKFAEQEFVSLRRGDEEIGWAQQFDTSSIKNGTWQMMQLSCPVLSCSNDINNITTRTTVRSMDPSSSSSHHHDLNTTVEKKKKKKNANYKDDTTTTNGPKSQTLQLFPLETINEKTADRDINSSQISTPHAPFHYFEFLPPKP